MTIQTLRWSSRRDSDDHNQDRLTSGGSLASANFGGVQAERRENCLDEGAVVARKLSEPSSVADYRSSRRTIRRHRKHVLVHIRARHLNSEQAR